MAVWQDSGLQWNSGLVPLCESDFVCIDHKYYLNSNYTVKEKETLQNAKEVWMKGDHPRKLQILTFPAYCRYRGLKKRLLSGMCLTRAQLVALGGVIAENKSTRVLFCRDSFHHPYLDKFELSGDNKAPVLKGRPRKKKKLNAAQNSVLKKKRFVADIQNHLVTNSHAAKRCKLSEEEESTGSDMSEGVLERTKAPPQVGRKVQSIGPPPLVKPRVQVTIPDKAETVEIPEVAAKDATQSRGETPKVPPPLIPSNIVRGDVVRTPQPLQSSRKHSNGNITECSRTTPIQKVICASSTKLRDLQKVNNNNNNNNYSSDVLMIKPHLTERSQTKATVAPVTSSSPTLESKPGRIMNSLVENRKVSKPGTTVTHTQSLSSGVRTIPTVQADVHSHSVSRTRPLTTTQGTVSTHLVTSTCPVVRDQPIASLQQPNISIQTVAPKPQQTLTPLVGSKSSSVNTCDGMTASGDLYVRSKPSKENEERQLRLGISEEKKENEIDQTDESVAWKKKKKRLRMPGNVKDEEYDGDDEKDFMQALRDFMRKNNQPLGKLPALGFKKVNLWTMYCTTQKFGGYDAVTSKRLWRRVYDSLGGSTTITSAATYTRRHYERLLLPYEKHVRNQLKKQMDEKNPSLVNSLPQNQPLDKPEKKQGLTVSNKAKQETNKAAVLKQNQGAVEVTPTRLPQDVIAVSSVQSPPYMMKTTTLKASEVKTTESGQVHTVMASSESKTSFKQGVSPVAVQSFKQEHEEPKPCSSNSKTGAAPPITSATEKQNRDTPTDQRTTEKRPQDTTQQNRKYIKTMQSDEDASLATSTMYAKNTTAANSNLKQSVQAVPIQRVFRGVHDDNLMPPTPQLLNSVSKGREIIDLTSDDSPPRSQSKSHLVPHVQGSQANAQDLSKMQRCGSGDTEGRRHGHKSQMRQEYHESSKRHHPAREVQTSGEVPSVYDMQTYSVQPFNNNRVARQVQDSSPTIKKNKDEGYPLVKQETFPPKHDKKRHQQPRVESLEGRYTHSPSSDSADEHFAEWFRRQSNVQHHRPKCSVSHHMPSPNPELGQFRYGYVSEDMRATDCSCSLPTSRKDEIVSVPPTKSKKEHYEEDLPFPGIAMYPGRWSPSMVTDHPDLYISSHPPHLGVPPDALASHLCTPSRIFIPTAQIFSPPYHMGMAPMGAPPLIAGTDDQLHIHPHCLMASSYPRSSSSRTPDGTGYPLYSFT